MRKEKPKTTKKNKKLVIAIRKLERLETTGTLGRAPGGDSGSF